MCASNIHVFLKQNLLNDLKLKKFCHDEHYETSAHQLACHFHFKTQDVVMKQGLFLYYLYCYPRKKLGYKRRG